MKQIIEHGLTELDFIQSPNNEISTCAYYCESCCKLLTISEHRIINGVKEQLLEKQCSRCGTYLFNSPRDKSYNFQHDMNFWNHQEIGFQNKSFIPLIYQRNNFQRANSLFGLNTQVEFIDVLLGGIQQNWFSVFFGSKFCHMLSERLSVKSQLSRDFGGWESPSIFIDAGNSFDIYLFTDISREYGIQPKKALDGIIISRSFTIFQLLHTIRHKLPEIIDRTSSRFIVISDIFNMFTEDVDNIDSKKMVMDMIEIIIKLCKTKRISILATNWTNRNGFEDIIRPRANMLVEFREQKNTIDVSLIKHPTRNPTCAHIQYNDKIRNQMLLQPIERTVNG